MLTCEPNKLASVFDLSSDYLITHVTSLSDSELGASAQLAKFDDSITTVYFKKSYQMKEMQTDALIFIDSVTLLKTTTDGSLVTI